MLKNGVTDFIVGAPKSPLSAIKKAEHQRIDAFELCVVLEKNLESTLNGKEIQPVNPIGNRSRIFPGRTDAEAEAPILRTPDVKN